MSVKSKRLIKDSFEEIKAVDTVFLNLKKLNSFTDVLIVTTGTSTRHMSAIKDRVIEDLKKNELLILGVEGADSPDWVLVDLGDIVLNIMSPDSRKIYDLESLWDPNL